MEFIASILPFIQIVISALLITAVLLQSRGSSVGGAFGGDNMGTTFYTRRGAEKMLFRFTVILALLFAVTSFITLFL